MASRSEKEAMHRGLRASEVIRDDEAEKEYDMPPKRKSFADKAEDAMEDEVKRRKAPKAKGAPMMLKKGGNVKKYAEGGETKSSRTKMLEEQPKNFMQSLATKVSKGLDKIGITQEKEYKGKTKEEMAVKKAKGGSVENKKQRNRDLGDRVMTLERNYPDNPKDYEPKKLPRDLEQERKTPRHEKGPFKGYSKDIQPLRKGGRVRKFAEGGVSEDYRKEKQKEIAARKAEREAEEKTKKDALSKAVYDRAVKQYESERKYNKPGTMNGRIDKFMDKVGDKARAVGKFFGTNRMTSMDDEAQMQARKDVKGYKKGGSAKKSIDGCAIRGKTRAGRK